MTKKIQKSLALLLMMSLILSGCSAGSMSNSAKNETAVMDTAAGSGWGEEMKEEPDMESMTEDSMDDAGAEEGGSARLDQAARKLIKTVSLSMETKEFDTMKSKLEESVTSFGGYIEDSNFDAPQGTYRYRYYSLTVRIPAEKLDEFVENTGKLGTLTNKSENVEDVTLDYVDKKAYKESLQVEYERVMELLEKAEDLEQVLALESKLSQLRYEINRYESQLRTYDNLIDYSTVRIYIAEVEYEKEVSDTIGSRISNGFRSSLYAVRDFFVDLFVGLVSNLPVLLLVAAVLVLMIVIIRKTVKHSREKRRNRMFSATAMYREETDSKKDENTKKEEH